MRIEQLEYVVEIAKQKSFSMAANNLHVSQQSLSQSIKNLETELGVELFSRTNRGVTQTREGELVLDFSHEMLERYARLQDQLQNLMDVPEQRDELRGKLMVYTCRSFYLSFLPSVVKEFLKKYPQVQLEVIEHDSKNIYEVLEQCAQQPKTDACIGLVNLPYADCGILESFAVKEGYTFRPITSGKFKLLVSKESELASYKQISARKLAQYPVVQYRTSQFPNTPLYNLLMYYGYEIPHIALSVDSFELWVEAIKNDLGVGFMHEVACRKNAAYYDVLQQLAAVNIKEVWGGSMGCISRIGDSPLIHAFLECFPDYQKRKKA
ncbi:MAG: LysR family transcriptional regulator [Peptococcaceae bacterium]